MSSRRLSLWSLLSWLGSLGLLVAGLPALLAWRLLPAGLVLAGLAALLALLVSRLPLVLAGLARRGRPLALLLVTTAGRLLSGTARLLPPLRWLVATLLTVDSLLASLVLLAGPRRLPLLAGGGLRRSLAAGLTAPLSRLALLCRLALLRRLPLSGLTLLLARSTLLLAGVSLLAALGSLSALLAELLVARLLGVATLLARLLARGITRRLLAWRPLLRWPPLPSPAVLAVLSASVLGAAVLPSHGVRPDGRTTRSE